MLEEPSPRLVLEYLPLGNLEDQHRLRNISDIEVLTLVRQSSAALSYLHGLTEPIVHRDIKPENILVLSRSPFHIKLADFGLAKASIYLETMCGTLTYVATEIARYYGTGSARGLKYTCAVDIWSLGVVVYQYSHGLPGHVTNFGLPWCQQIVDALHDWDSDDLLDLLSGMLVIEPTRRGSAEECLQRAWEVEGPQTPKLVHYERRQRELGESEPTIIEPTIMASPNFRQENSYFGDSEIQRYIKSHILHQSGARVFEDNVPYQDSLGSIRDSEIQGYIRTQVHHSSCAPALADGLRYGDSWA